MRKVLIALALLLLVLPTMAHAQTATVTTASSLTFQSSPDHNALDPGTGQALVTSYQADAVVVTGPTGALGWTQGLGKPTPAGDAYIAITGSAFASLYNAMSPGVVYTLKVSAVGPGGAAASAASNPFGRAGQAGPPRAPGAPGTPTIR